MSKLLADLPGNVQPKEALIERAIRLDRLYIPPRYPNGFDTGIFYPPGCRGGY